MDLNSELRNNNFKAKFKLDSVPFNIWNTNNHRNNINNQNTEQLFMLSSNELKSEPEFNNSPSISFNSNSLRFPLPTHFSLENRFVEYSDSSL